MNSGEAKVGYWSQSSHSVCHSLYSIPRANPSVAFHLGRDSVLRVAHRCKVGARAEAQARTNVSQSVGPQPLRLRTICAARESSVVLPSGLRLESGIHSRSL